MTFAPGHRELLAETNIEVCVARKTQLVSITSLAVIRSAPTLIRVQQACAKEFVSLNRTRLNGSKSNAATLNVPVCGPASVIIGAENRETCIPAPDAAHLPPTDKCVGQFVDAAEILAATTERHFPNRVGI